MGIEGDERELSGDREGRMGGERGRLRGPGGVLESASTSIRKSQYSYQLKLDARFLITGESQF